MLSYYRSSSSEDDSDCEGDDESDCDEIKDRDGMGATKRQPKSLLLTEPREERMGEELLARAFKCDITSVLKRDPPPELVVW